MNQPIIPEVKLNNGVLMPQFGLGVWRTKDGQEVVHAVKSAVSAGYRSIDTAAVYQNEQGVGQAVRECGVPREQLFITTKVWNSDQGYDSTLKAFEESRKKLGLEYVDLYLIHWPGKDKFKDTWKALEKLYKDGLVRAIGVSNFKEHHLDRLLDGSEVVPALNQVEFHPLLNQKGLLSYCSGKGIQLEAWSPLMQGHLDQPFLQSLADKYGKTAAQIVLRWDIQLGIVTIPKSVTADRIRSNAQIFDFELSSEDMAAIGELNENRRFGPDPDQFF